MLNSALGKKGPVSEAFLSLGVTTFEAACAYVEKLRYARPSKPGELLNVLEDQCGACSGKHRLLSALADELSLPIKLMVGIYPMKEANTTGVGEVLVKAKLDYMPEAHCYLAYQGERYDYTGLPHLAKESIEGFFYEESFSWQEVLEKKLSLHQEYIQKQFCASTAYTFDELWAIREDCIAALSNLSAEENG